MDTISNLFKHVKQPTVPANVSEITKLNRLNLMEHTMKKKLHNFLVKEAEVQPVADRHGHREKIVKEMLQDTDLQTMLQNAPADLAASGAGGTGPGGQCNVPAAADWSGHPAGLRPPACA